MLIMYLSIVEWISGVSLTKCWKERVVSLLPSNYKTNTNCHRVSLYIYLYIYIACSTRSTFLLAGTVSFFKKGEENSCSSSTPSTAMSEKVANELMIKLAKRRSWEQTETPEKSIQELRESVDADNLTMSNSKDNI